MDGKKERAVRWDVFIPCFLVIGGAAILGVVNNRYFWLVIGNVWMALSMGRFRDVAPHYNLGIFSPGQDSLRRAPCQGKIFLWRLVCHDAYRWNCNWPHYLWCQ